MKGSRRLISGVLSTVLALGGASAKRTSFCPSGREVAAAVGCFFGASLVFGVSWWCIDAQIRKLSTGYTGKEKEAFSELCDMVLRKYGEDKGKHLVDHFERYFEKFYLFRFVPNTPIKNIPGERAGRVCFNVKIQFGFGGMEKCFSDDILCVDDKNMGRKYFDAFAQDTFDEGKVPVPVLILKLLLEFFGEIVRNDAELRSCENVILQKFSGVLACEYFNKVDLDAVSKLFKKCDIKMKLS